MKVARLRLTVDEELLARLCLLTGGGFQVDLPVACSVRELLCGQLGVAPEYLEGRIQTIFLNSRPVDDPATATVTPGATLALSGPMPGLAGAICRKGGATTPCCEAACPAAATAPPRAAVGTRSSSCSTWCSRSWGPRFSSGESAFPAPRWPTCCAAWPAGEVFLCVCGDPRDK